MKTQEITHPTQTYQNSEYELWSVVQDGNEVMPLFLEGRGYFDVLYLKFKENNNTIITDKEGNIKETHLKCTKRK